MLGPNRFFSSGSTHHQRLLPQLGTRSAWLTLLCPAWKCPCGQDSVTVADLGSVVAWWAGLCFPSSSLPWGGSLIPFTPNYPRGVSSKSLLLSQNKKFTVSNNHYIPTVGTCGPLCLLCHRYDIHWFVLYTSLNTPATFHFGLQNMISWAACWEQITERCMGTIRRYDPY